ncbi:MAG: proton-conducting transporter membrane subunit [Bacteroidota bacterium]|nr:proton-conducting transporter membrane subunit [Bacteroidota bacterium]
MTLEIFLATAFGGAFITYFLGKLSKKVRDVFAVLISLVLAAMVAMLYNASYSVTYYIGFLDIPLILRINSFSWLFAIVIVVIGSFSVIFSLSYIRKKGNTDFYYAMMLLVIASMIGIVLSGDLVSFYVFWEIMSWSTFLLISYNRGPAIAAGMKYIIMSVTGSVIMLVGIISLYSHYGTMVFTELSGILSGASTGYVLFILILFFIAFGIKNAIWPLHVWLPPAHSEAPSPFSAILSGILIKIGTYGIILLIYVIIHISVFMNLGDGILSARYILSIIGAITIIVGTFIALLQDDAKRLLAWSTVAQAGYIILGIAYGTSESVASGTFHFFNHAIFKSLLFMVVGAIEFRTNGVRDLNSLGGLIKKMPVTFLGAMIGVCGLIGVPLTNGFVSKWLIYKTLILNNSPFLAFAALLGTWGTILYSYKFIHNIFLGQLPEKYNNIKKAPFNMQLPIVILSLAIIVFGIVPGLPLNVINTIGTGFGLKPLMINIWGLASDTGVLNMLNISVAVIVISLIVWLIFKGSKRASEVDQYDSYAAGAAVPKDKYQYSVNFYGPLYRMITPYFKNFVDGFYMRLAGGIKNLGNGLRRIYTGDVGHYAMYIILFLALLIFIQITWALW